MPRHSGTSCFILTLQKRLLTERWESSLWSNSNSTASSSSCFEFCRSSDPVFQVQYYYPLPIAFPEHTTFMVIIAGRSACSCTKFTLSALSSCSQSIGSSSTSRQENVLIGVLIIFDEDFLVVPSLALGFPFALTIFHLSGSITLPRYILHIASSTAAALIILPNHSTL